MLIGNKYMKKQCSMAFEAKRESALFLSVPAFRYSK